MANSTDPFGKSVFGGQTSIPGGTATAATTTATPAMPWKSYSEYFKDQPDAAKYGHYQSSYLPTPGEDQSRWPTGKSPYRFAEEYNQYKTTLPQQYQELISYGISPEQVQSGAVNSIVRGSGLEKIQLPGSTAEKPLYAGAGSGSTNTLDADVLAKMWK